MILQKDPRALPEIQEFGCYYMSLLWFANKYKNVELGFPFINDFYQKMKDKKYISKQNLIQKPGHIFYDLGFLVRYKGHIPSSYICRPDEFEILHFIWKDLHHFTGGDGHGILTYDPYGESQTAKNGIVKNKRVFEIL